MAGGNDRSSVPDKGMGKLNLNAVEFRPPPASAPAPANPGRASVGGKKGSKGHGSYRNPGDNRGGRQRREEKDAEGSEARGSGRGRGKGQAPRAVPRAKGTGATDPNAVGSPSSSNGADLVHPDASPGAGPCRRGVRADFLLNFTSPHRENLVGANTERARGTGRGGGRGGGAASAHGNRGHRHGPHPSRGQRRSVYRKELFLQANFRFLVADWADLRGAASDPDHMVDWDDVVLVEMASATPLSCPVCLDEPMTCAQVTLCGHAFCFPCIARHAATVRKEGEPAKCPMCFTPLRLADLRTVRRRPIDPIGEEAAPSALGGGLENDGNLRKPPGVDKGVIKKNARLTLLSRRRDSAVPIPVRAAGGRTSRANDESGEPNDWPRSTHGADGGRCDLFAKYTLTADEALLGEEESGALEQRVAFMAAEGGAEAEQELPFTLLACDAMQARLEAWAEKRARASNLPPPPKGPSRGDAAAKAAERAAERAARERSMDGAFPALPGSNPSNGGAGGGHRSRRPPGMTAADWHDHSVAFLMGKAVEAASAFTDEEDEDESESDPESDAESEPRGPTPRDGAGGTGFEGGEGFEGSEAAGGSCDAVGAAAAEDMDAHTVESGGVIGASTSSSSSSSTAPSTRQTHPSGPSSNGPPPPPTRTEVYYFYQAEDGQPVVLHGACVRALLAHHGSYDSLPTTLEAPVVELERHTQDEDTRRRAAHLRHLPLTTQYAIAELDMTKLVPAETLRGVDGEELRRREERRRKRADAERKAEAAAVAAEARERRNARVFSADKRGAMPDVRGLADRRRAAVRRSGDACDDDDDAINDAAGLIRSRARGGAAGLTPEEALARARTFAEEEEAAFAAEMAAAREAAFAAAGPRGASFSRVARWGFASGLDAPSLTPDYTAGDAFGPSLSATRPGLAAGGDGGGSGGAWGAAARSAEPSAAAAAEEEEGRRRKGRKGTVLFEMGGARRY